jgi:hypothetical protein
MICTTCYCMLRGQNGRQWQGTYDLHFSHHSTVYSLERSAAMGCCICRVIWDELTENEQGEKFAKVLQKHLRSPSYLDRLLGTLQATDGAERSIYFVRAFLSELSSPRGLYRLDFRLVDSDSKRLATFVLEQTRKSNSSLFVYLSRVCSVSLR